MENGKKRSTSIGNVSLPKDITGLRVRREPTAVYANSFKTLKNETTVVIDDTFVNEYFYKIIKPVKGYVMRRYVITDGQHTKFSKEETRNFRQTNRV